MQLPLSREDETFQASLTLNLENSWLFRNYQYRTFDLIDKEWSRYLLMRLKDQTTNTTTPGVNVLTHKVRVSPHNTMDFSTTFRGNYDIFEVELGYGAWAHGGDTIRITSKSPWVAQYGIAGTTTNTSASGSTIITKASNDTTFTTIKETDLDLTSGAMPQNLVHKIHGSFGCAIKHHITDGNFGVGAFVELPNNSTKALSTWGIWVKLGGAF